MVGQYLSVFAIATESPEGVAINIAKNLNWPSAEEGQVIIQLAYKLR